MSTRPIVTGIASGLPSSGITTLTTSSITSSLPSGGLTGSSGGLLGSLGGPLTSIGTGLLSNLLGSLDIKQNIDNVVKYGLSSWGASTTPEKSTAQFNSIAVPFVQDILAGLNANNIQEVINEIEKYLTFIIKLEKQNRRN